MEFIRHVVQLNRDVIYFAYGLVFFVLGLAIALQSRNYSRLDLARSLKWLAAFGFAHGFYEWGDLFIPIQAEYLSAHTIEILHYFHLLLLAGSFTFLFEFGVNLLRPLQRLRWLHGVSPGFFAVWFFIVYFPLPTLLADFNTWHSTANALARYFIGFPAGLLAAYGLRQHTFQRIAPLKVPHIYRMLQFAGIMLFLYAVFSGLLPPAVPFFPGNFLNAQSFERAFGVPPPVFRSLIGLGLAIAIIRGLEIFDVETERTIETMEQQQILNAERNRIARQLHDGAIQKVYTAGLLVESIHKLSNFEDKRLASRLGRAETVLNDAIKDLRYNLTELHSKPVEEPFGEALHRIADDPRFRSLVDIDLEMELPISESLTPIRSEHVLSIVNEALSNIIRHSRAKKVKLSARKVNHHLRVVIEDDGIGIPAIVESGYGLRNMRDRARLLGGELEITAKNGRGTVVRLEIPWREER
jgi:signal transduction histidine kinase